MPIGLIVTGGLGNGTLSGDTAAIISRGLLGGAEVTVLAGLTGSLAPSTDEATIVSTGGTLIITLTNSDWIAAGTGPIGTIAQSNAIVNGFTSNKSEAGGWNAQVRDILDYTALTRDSATQATLTVPATVGFDISFKEIVTPTIPNAVLTGSTEDVVADPFQINAAGVEAGALSKALSRALSSSLSS